MSVEGLEDYSKDNLIDELINRSTFAGIVVFCRGDVKDGAIEPGEVVLTKSPPLTRLGVQELLRVGESLLSQLPWPQGEPLAELAPALPLIANPPPLRIADGGAVRVGDTRVSLDIVIEEYENGMGAEEIARAYDVLTLADVYGAIAFYLRYPNEVRTYLNERQRTATALREQIEGERPRITRKELLGRRAQENVDAPSGQ